MSLILKTSSRAGYEYASNCARRLIIGMAQRWMQKYLDKFLKYSFALPEKVVAQTEQDRVWVSIHHFEQLIKRS